MLRISYRKQTLSETWKAIYDFDASPFLPKKSEELEQVSDSWAKCCQVLGTTETVWTCGNSESCIRTQTSNNWTQSLFD